MKPMNWGFLSKYRREIMGFACLWVITFHFNEGEVYKGLLYLPSRLIAFGNMGVDIFLFVSGIGLYFAFQKKPTLGSFYKKRLVRLLVPYLILCVPYYVWFDLVSKGRFLLDITQISFVTDGMRTTWYIPAILCFYLLFPLIYHLQNKEWSRMTRGSVTVTMFTVWTVVLLLIKRFLPDLYGNVEVALIRFLIFLIGCHFGKAVYEKKTMGQETVFLCGSFVLLFIIAFDRMVSLPLFWGRISYVPFAMTVCILLAAFLSLFKNENNFLQKILRFCGDRSLELYLSHVLIRNVWYEHLSSNYFGYRGVIDYSLIILISFAISIVLHPICGKISDFLLRKRGEK